MSEDERNKFLTKAKFLEGKTLKGIQDEILKEDGSSRVKTKAAVGYVIEQYFNLKKNSSALPDMQYLAIEIKTSPLKYSNRSGTLRSKEPLSLNIINYTKEVLSKSLKESSLYKKNKEILLVFYVHDKEKERSDYLIKHVFLWEMDDQVIAELEPDYLKILNKIKKGEAHDIHQGQHKYLTLCPKHSGKFKDPLCNISKTKQPYSAEPAQVKAFRLKNIYMNLILDRYLASEYQEIFLPEETKKIEFIIVHEADQPVEDRREYIPVYESVSAGEGGAVAVKTTETYVNHKDVGVRESDLKSAFVVHVSGNSMNKKEIKGKNIENKDCVVAIQQDFYRSGDIVVVILEIHDTALIKEYCHTGKKVVFKPHSTDKKEKNITIKPGEPYSIRGKVIDVIKASTIKK